MKSGIYKILNTITEKFYIGSAINLKIRIKGHKYKLRHNKHCNALLQASWNLHGEEAFEFEVLEYCDKEKLIEKEQYWLDLTQCYDKIYGYNINKIANSRLGIKHTEETKLKFKNRIISIEQKERLRNIRLGTISTLETRAKQSASLKGKMTAEHKAILIASAKTPQARENKRLARLGKPSNNPKSNKWKHIGGHWRCKCNLCRLQINEYKKLKLREYRA